MRFRKPNYCRECGREIPRWERAYCGNKYRPVVCMPCVAKAQAKLWGSMERYRAARARAIREEPPL